MDEESILSDLDFDYQTPGTSKESVDFKRTLKRKALSVLEVYSAPRLPEEHSFRGIYNGYFLANNPDLAEMDHSDLSDDISITNSDTNSVESNRWTVECLENYGVLKNRCQRLGLKFVDRSEDIQERRYLNSDVMKMNLTVNCLYSYEELIKECDALGLTFVDCSLLNTQAKRRSLNSDVMKMNLTVNCLYSYEELIEECEALGLTFVDCSSLKKSYEVDLILQDKLEEGQKYYFVKWKDYDLNTNTWEPDYHLTGCHEMITYYEYLKSSESVFDMNHFCYFVRELMSRKPYDILTIIKLLSITTSTSEDLIKKNNFTLTELKYKARKCLSNSLHEFQGKEKQLLKLMRFAEQRKPVLINLKEWEYEINNFNPTTYVEVENNVDLEEAPTDFQFIHDYISEGIEITEEPAVFCNCDNCYSCKDLCCPGHSEARFAYNKFGRLQLLPGYPIYECNKHCKCGIDCVNRVVQHGPKINVAIFRTSNGCGWGLKTLETIQKDQFVLEYLGEILTSDAAELRDKEYDIIGRSYLFDLDYGDCKYTVDAGHVGNASHFINHSCEPNLHVFAVWINCHDPQLPRLAFFAKKKISRGEELTFDYKMYLNKDKFGSSTHAQGKTLCKCNSRRCRKYLC